MIQLMAWTERTFEYQWPVRLMPALLERLRGAPPRAAALLGEFADAQIRDARHGWSALEHVGHLDDLHGLDMRRLQEFLSRAPVLSAADMTNRATYEARHNEGSTAALLDRFRAHRSEFAGRLEALTEADAGIASEHPRLRRQLRLIDWLHFVAEHDDHHLARAREILKNV
jgi:hypothetical protein